MEAFELRIETDRLIIRPFAIEDYENWYTQYANRLPAQSPYDDGRPADLTTSSEDWFTEWVTMFDSFARKDEFYHFGIFRKEDGVNVGKIELIKLLRLDYDWATMGDSIHNPYWRQGYALESVKAAAETFFTELNFHRIELHINVDNEPLIQLALKAGFEYECVRKNFSRANNVWADLAIYYKNRTI